MAEGHRGPEPNREPTPAFRLVPPKGKEAGASTLHLSFLFSGEYSGSLTPLRRSDPPHTCTKYQGKPQGNPPPVLVIGNPCSSGNREPREGGSSHSVVPGPAAAAAPRELVRNAHSGAPSRTYSGRSGAQESFNKSCFDKVVLTHVQD